MSCSSCGKSNGLPRGCKGNGQCSVDGCSTYPVFDWLANMSLPAEQEAFDVVELRFKNGRKEFFRNDEKLPLTLGEALVVEVDSGYDVGTLSMRGELVRLQIRKQQQTHRSDDFPKILRKASEDDMRLWEQMRDKEDEALLKAREVAQRLDLKMKFSDVEFQGDGQKGTFYYTADQRVDFRQLVRDLAAAFKLRVEMKQIGNRQEAGRLGGIGVCGRELCCSTWLHDYRTVSTSAARYQQLSLNPEKLAGQCGKLKCCLNFELDTYMEALEDFPNTKKKLHTEKGVALFMKMDLFNGYLWYAYKEDSSEWHKIAAADVKEILEKNKNGEKIPSLVEFVVEEETVQEPKDVTIDSQDDLNRFDDRFGKRRNKRKKKKGGRAQQKKETGGTEVKAQRNKPSPEGSSRPQEAKRRSRPRGGKRRSNRSGGNKNAGDGANG